MAKNGTQVIEISPSSSERYSEEEDDNGTPLRPVFCAKRNTDIKRIEEIEECFILDFDPFDSIDISKLSVSNSPIDNEVSVVAEKGQVLDSLITTHFNDFLFSVMGLLFYTYWVFLVLVVKECRTQKDPFFCCY